MITQLSVFLENAPGRLALLAKTLGDANINMHALIVADTSDYGVARIVCDRPDDAAVALRYAGMSVTATKIVAVEVPDKPGALGRLLIFLAESNIDVAYSYVFVEPKSSAAVSVFKLTPDSAVELLSAAGYRLLDDEMLAAQY